MFGLFGKRAPEPLRSEIVFDEAYCHSAGLEEAKTYQIAKATTELRFVFPDPNGFWQLYVVGNPYLDPRWQELHATQKAVFVTMAINGDGQYMHQTGIAEDGTVLMNAETLVDFGAGKPFRVFDEGMISFGLYELGAFNFNVLWATMYQSS